MSHIKLFLTGALVFFAAACTPSATVKNPGAAQERLPASRAPVPKSRIGVMEFSDKSAQSRMNLGVKAADLLSDELEKSGKFIVVEREKIKKLLESSQLQGHSAPDAQMVAALAEKIGLDAVVTGVVASYAEKTAEPDAGNISAEADLAIRLIDVHSGLELLTDSSLGTADFVQAGLPAAATAKADSEIIERAALRASILQFVDAIAEQLNKRIWSCVVVSAAGPQLYINAGQNSGIKPGQRLDCYSKGPGHAEQYLGSAEVESYCGDSGNCSVASLSGAVAQAGDICRLAKY